MLERIKKDGRCVFFWAAACILLQSSSNNNILLGSTDTTTTIQEQMDSDHNVKSISRVTHGVAAKDKLKAIDMIAKLTGLYDQNKEIAKATGKEYQAILKAQREELLNG